MRRLKVVRVLQDMLFHLLTTGVKPAVEVRDGLPAGAEFDGAKYDPILGTFSLRFRHESFPEVPEFCAIPELTPTCQRATEEQVVRDAFDRGVMVARFLAQDAADAPAVVGRPATAAEAEWVNANHPDLKPGQGVELPADFTAPAVVAAGPGEG